MIEVKSAFSKYYKTERDRNEQALTDIFNIVCAEKPAENIVNDILDCLERHYARTDR